ncbi:WXG100 family type VII secretion target [Actinomadura algeriensis]|uniref:Uncharacterized protein YukE n=1 Tax=Actinomadura algeriensis TaxID=1679523 RepID=A0ABR9JS81_9ACTN|nr:hypothetical protein [Actinomadura algeriensis]MBE1533338.1 uncharacterized protein YukE [Actinomadura algeriensis]
MGNEKFPIRDGKTWSEQSFSDMSFDDVKNQLASLRPEAVGDASTAYKDAADILAEMTEELRNGFAVRLRNNWQGENAQKALDQMGQIFQTAGALSDKSHNTAETYNWYKVSILDWYKAAAEEMTDGYVHTGGDDDNAREFIAKFSRRMGEAYNAHPNDIEKDLPREYGGLTDNPTTPNYPGGNPGGPGGMPGGGGGSIPGGAPGGMPGGAPGGMPGGGGGSFAGENPFAPPTNNGPHLQPGEVTPGGNWGSGSGGSGGSPWDSGNGSTGLSSFPGGASGGGGLSGIPGGGPGGGGLPGGGGGGLPGGGGGGIPGGAPGAFGGVGGGMGAGGMGPGAGAGGAGAAGRGAGAAGGARPMGMPMAPGGGGAGQGDQERERETWLTEDEDVWGANDDTAPPVIG